LSPSHVDRSPSRRQLCVFAIAWLVFFGSAGGAVLLRGGSTTAAAILWALAAVVPGVGWGFPPLLRAVFVGTAYLAFPLGCVLSCAMLGAVFYLVFAPAGLLMRLLGYDPLQRRRERRAESYWVPRPKPADWKQYFRQY